MREKILALILAAGKGTRFKSEKNKVLHPLMGKSMLHWVVDSVSRLKPEGIYVVVGYQKEEVLKEPFQKNVHFVSQERQLGTAHAVQSAEAVLEKWPGKSVLIINGDLPLITPETLKPLINLHEKERNALTFLSADVDDPKGFGRIARGKDKTIRIVEERDATSSELKIREINAGIYMFRVKDLFQVLPKISNANKKREYYLTDAIEIMASERKKIGVCKAANAEEIVGVNDRYELSRVAKVLRDRKIRSLAEDGVTVYDPETTWIDVDVLIGIDTVIHSSVRIEGKSVVGANCTVYPFVHLVNARIGNNVKILSSTMIEESVIEDDVRVGPFSHLRPKTVLKKGSRIGNFVEMKNTVFGPYSKAGHLTYLGDAEVKENVNIGAGTITCNYDGREKHKTLIEDEAFIGSGTELVAPVKIGKGAYVGAGSTITKNVSPDSLAVSRGKQVEKRGWAKRKKKN